MSRPPDWILACAAFGFCLMGLGGAEHVFGPAIGEQITKLAHYGFGFFSAAWMLK